MLERLSVTNFQVHEKFALDLDPFVTCLTGPSDSGKTALVRALRWVVSNDPSGDEFITHGAGLCKVSLKVDGHKVTRRRGKGVNSYTLDGKAYVAFGMGKVPDEIASLLNVSPVTFQSQLDSPFWLTLPAGEVSRQLNAVVNLERMDGALSSLASSLRRARVTHEITESRLKKAREEETSLSWCVGADDALKSLEALEEGLVSKRASLARAECLVKSVSDSASEKADALCADVACLNALSRGEASLELQAGVSSLEGLLLELGDCSRPASLESLSDDVKNVDRLASSLKEAGDKVKSLEGLVSSVITAGAESCRLKEESRSTFSELTSLTGGLCPLCSGPLRLSP